MDIGGLLTILSEYPKAEGCVYSYGTAGFRTNGEKLFSTIARMGLLMSIRSRALKQICGIIVTASHNPAADNGIKLVDPSGDMLEISWEKYANDLANAEIDQIPRIIEEILALHPPSSSDCCGEIYIARDTRSTSEPLVSALKSVLDVLGTKYTYFGLLTTPQLHFCVQMANKHEMAHLATEDGYYQFLCEAFYNLVQEVRPTWFDSARLVIDASNGVGASKFARLMDELHSRGISYNYELRNTGEGPEDVLNDHVGAAFVVDKQVPPKNISVETDLRKRIASFDGDADRFVYHYFVDESHWKTFDCGKAAVLFADFFNTSVYRADISAKIDVVLTAYCNNACVNFIRNTMHLNVLIAKTGVKNLKMRSDADIKVCFEANGHGTVYVSDSVIEQCERVAETGTVKQKAAALGIINAKHLINQACGDAFSDVLMLEMIMAVQRKGLSELDEIYSEYPHCATVMTLAQKGELKPCSDETRLDEPKALQDEIDRAVASIECGRAFVRPSGTEPVVRVYSEAKTQSEADDLAKTVCSIVSSYFA